MRDVTLLHYRTVLKTFYHSISHHLVQEHLEETKNVLNLLKNWQLQELFAFKVPVTITHLLNLLTYLLTHSLHGAGRYLKS